MMYSSKQSFDCFPHQLTSPFCLNPPQVFVYGRVVGKDKRHFDPLHNANSGLLEF